MPRDLGELGAQNVPPLIATSRVHPVIHQNIVPRISDDYYGKMSDEALHSPNFTALVNL